MKYKETSDHINTDYGETPGKRASVRIGFARDSANRACGFYFAPEKKDDEPNMIAVLERAHAWYPFDASLVAWPSDGWPVDADGRGLSVLEVQEQHLLPTMENAA